MKVYLLAMGLIVCWLFALYIMVISAGRSESEQIRAYTDKCNSVGGVVAEWTTQGVPHSKQTMRTCVDPKMILEVK